MNKLEQKEIELVQSYLTQEEAKTIIPQYIKNFKDDFRRNLSFDLYAPHDFLNYAFEWSKTDQGHRYWEDIQIKLRERYYETV